MLYLCEQIDFLRLVPMPSLFALWYWKFVSAVEKYYDDVVCLPWMLLYHRFSVDLFEMRLACWLFWL